MAVSRIWLATWVLSLRTAAQFYSSQSFDLDPQSTAHDFQFHDFITRPDIIAPKWDIEVYDREALSPGYWFVSPYETILQSEHGNRPWFGPHIYDMNGGLVWSGTPMFNGFTVNDFRVSNVNGQDTLTGIFVQNTTGVLIDGQYQLQQEIPIFQDEFDRANRHDFHIVENGRKALSMTHYMEDSSADELATTGSDSCVIAYSGFQEYDINNKEVVYRWGSKGYIHLNESYAVPNCERIFGWDYLHANSIDKAPDGDYIFSGRHANTVYKISAKDGSIVWRLGGKQSDFELDTPFSGQHAVRVLSQNITHTVLSLFDNAYLPDNAVTNLPQPLISNDQSRGMVIALRTDAQPMTATTLQTFNHPSGDYATGRGNLQMLENGNGFAGWWNNSMLSEYAPDGTTLMEAKLRSQLRSYRCYKSPWIGRPATPPDVYAIAVQDHYNIYANATTPMSDVTTVVYVSWNGATQVAYWYLYDAEENGERTQFLASTSRSGFETTITFRGSVKDVIVEARDNDRQILGQSTVCTVVQPSANWTHPSMDVFHEATIEDFFCQPQTMYALAAITGVCVVLLVTILVYYRRRGAGTSWRWLSWSRNEQKYEVVRDMDVEDEAKSNQQLAKHEAELELDSMSPHPEPG